MDLLVSRPRAMRAFSEPWRNGPSSSASGARSSTWSPIRTPTRGSSPGRENTPYGRLSTSKSEPRRSVHPGHRGASSSPRASRSSRGSLTLQEPYDVNHRRVRAHRVVALVAPLLEQHVGDPFLEGRHHLVRPGAVERQPGREQDVDEALVLEAVRARVPQRVVQPGRALERRLPVERRVDPVGQGRRGREQVGLQPAGAELQPQLGLGDGVGGAQPVGSGLLLRQLDVDRGLVLEHPVGAGRVDGGDHAAGVAGQVVGVAQRHLDPGHVGTLAPGQVQRRPDRTGPAGDHDRQRDPGVDVRDLDVGDDERADQVGVPLVGPGGVRRHGVGQRRVTGREDRGVVDQAAEDVGQGLLAGHRASLSHPPGVWLGRRSLHPVPLVTNRMKSVDGLAVGDQTATPAHETAASTASRQRTHQRRIDRSGPRPVDCRARVPTWNWVMPIAASAGTRSGADRPRPGSARHQRDRRRAARGSAGHAATPSGDPAVSTVSRPGRPASCRHADSRSRAWSMAR